MFIVSSDQQLLAASVELLPAFSYRIFIYKVYDRWPNKKALRDIILGGKIQYRINYAVYHLKIRPAQSIG